MLKTKIDPTYPVEALKHHASGTVLLLATIGSDGHITALQVISGPAQLHQAALEAVRSYRMNDRPVEVETTINVGFAPNL